MKAINYILILTSIFFITSCQKTAELSTSSQANSKQTEDLFGHNKCQITHVEDNITLATIDFFYNAQNNPGSVTFNNAMGFPVTAVLEYDEKGRLIKETFGSDVAIIDFKYVGSRPLLPAALTYTDYNGALVAIDSFRYNRLGEMTDRINISFEASDYNSIEHYTYNIQGNVVRVDINAYAGGAIYQQGYTEYKATKYDNKINIFSGSKWNKFALFFTDYDLTSPYSFSLFSRNNAADYVWKYDIYNNPGAAADSILSTFQYNSEGFATTTNMQWFFLNTKVTPGLFTKTATSSGDEYALNPGKATFAYTSFIKQVINRNRFSVKPITISQCIIP